MIPFKNRELRDKLWDAYQTAIQTQLELQPLLIELDELPWDESIPGIPGAKAWVKDNVVHFFIPAVPPIMRGATFRLQREIRDRWMHWIVYAYLASKISITFEQALVVITIYTEGKHVWDADNRSVHAILNGIRNCRLIKDDDWSHMAYLVRGFGGQETNRTDIAVLDANDKEGLLKVLYPQHPALPQDFCEKEPAEITY